MSQTYYGIFRRTVKNPVWPEFRLKNLSTPRIMNASCIRCVKHERRLVYLRCRRLVKWVGFNPLFPNVNPVSVGWMSLS